MFLIEVNLNRDLGHPLQYVPFDQLNAFAIALDPKFTKPETVLNPKHSTKRTNTLTSWSVNCLCMR
jgi:hypothetical protein